MIILYNCIKSICLSWVYCLIRTFFYYPRYGVKLLITNILYNTSPSVFVIPSVYTSVRNGIGETWFSWMLFITWISDFLCEHPSDRKSIILKYFIFYDPWTSAIKLILFLSLSAYCFFSQILFLYLLYLWMLSSSLLDNYSSC